MSDSGVHVSFADNLYGDCSSRLAASGAGLVGFCRNGFWVYERHDSTCKPGKWRVAIGGHESGEFWSLLGETDAVVDDFGNLRKVEPSHG